MAGKPRVLALILGASFCLSGLVSQQPAQARIRRATDGAGKSGLAGLSTPSAEPGVPGTSVDDAKRQAKPGVDRSSVLRLVLHANPMLWPLAICSIVTLGYVMERFAALRRERVIPREFVDRFLERLSSGKLDRERASSCVGHMRARRRGSFHWWSTPGVSLVQPSGKSSVTMRRAKSSSSSAIYGS